jgi:hypothetical protein
MKRQLALLLLGGAFVTASGAVMAHHSFAMFDQKNPVEIVGTVQEFKYVNPHCYILIEVKGADGSGVIWNLEGSAPALLSREGWTSRSLKPGDQLRLTIDPLHSGEPGGAWNPARIKFDDGRPIVVRQ